ncbi:uncharacterized protein LOC127356568 isoform X4 [Dicentrarchus labrax]|uniref:uncharacterized protein LOC127356568 isoform X4 n=1 Tax=Dicentrarchus labrax TaxID=13489 RepID=UPI0021F5DD24|nr:uncharacterized protein LOC127356568 isoform X4 [Dicentrarchus labrax]
MAIADQLLEQMFSWLEQRERCAEKLRKLAKELELLRQKCNAAECVGSTYAVVGALSLIGAGMATFFTGGAAAPLLGVAGAVFSGTGVTISVASKIIEGFSSSDTMKDAQRIEEKSNEVAEEIQRLFERLRANSSSADPDEVDRHVMTEILRAMARRNGLEGQINTQTFFDNIPMRFTQSFSNSELTIGLAGILSFFTLKTVGNEFKHLLDKGANELIKQVAKTGFKNVLKGGAKVVGGAVGLAFELPEAIDNWKDLIEKNHVTKASQSLRDTADAILDTCRTLREQFDNIRRMFEEMAKSKRELTSQHVVPQQAAHCDMTPMQQTWQKSVLAVGLQPFTSWAQPPTDQAASTHGFQSLITPVYPVPKQLGVPEVLTSRHVIRQPEPQGDPTTMQQTQPNSVLAVRSRPIYAQAQTPPSQAAFTHGLQSLISPVYPVPKQLGVHGLLTSWHVVPQPEPQGDPTPMQHTLPNSVLAVRSRPIYAQAQTPPSQAASTHGLQSLITPVHPVPKQLGVHGLLTSRHVVPQQEPQGDLTPMQKTQPKSVLPVSSRPISVQAQTAPSQAASTHGLQSLITPVHPVPKQLGVHGLLTSRHVVPQQAAQGDMTTMQKTQPKSVLAVGFRPISVQAQTAPSQAASTHGLQSLITPVHPVPKQLGVHGLLTSRHVVPQQEPQGDLTPMQKTQPKSVLPVGSRPISVQAQTAPSQAASTHGLQSLITPVHPVPKQLGVHGLLTSRHVVPQQEAVPRMASVWKEDKNVSREKNIQQGCKEKREPLNKHLFMSSNPAQDQSGNQQTSSPTDQRHQNEREGHQTEQTGRGQERESQQNKETGSGQQGGDDQGDKESDDEDEESDQEDEETDSEEESEEDESKKTGRKRRKRNRKKGTRSKQRGDSEEVVRQCQDSCIDQEQRTIQTPPGTIRVGLLNVRSMNNSRSRILELITQNNLDVFLTTETWLREDNADRVLREVSPQNYHYYYQVRVGQRGGGVANQFSQELQGENIPFDSLTTFECVVTVLHHDEWNQPVPVINVYHPPGYNRDQFRTFLDEFETLLAHFNNYNSLIVTGDFNIWVDQERRSFTDEFYHIWPIYNLEQHVREPTHEGGHTLDLVLTRNVEISGLVVRNDGISDHYTVDFKARPVSKDKREETKKEKDQR